MAEGTEGAQAPPPPQPDSSTTEDANAAFECNICLDTAKDAVVSYCGHLFCWPCLHQWLDTRPDRQMCPVCKAGISREKVIPLYGRGSTNNVDPRSKSPPRPAAQRSEPEYTGQFSNFNFGNFQMSFGIGAFPFSFFATTINQGDARPGNPASGTRQDEEENALSKIFIFVAVFFAIWLILA